MVQNRRFVIDKNMRFIFAFLHLNEVQILQKAGLPIDFFEKKTISLSTEEYYRFWTAVVEKTESDRPIPLLMEKLPLFAGISAPIMAALCSADFVTFVNRIKEFKPLIGPLTLTIKETDEYLSVSIAHIDPNKDLHPLIVALELVFFVKMMREGTGTEVKPVSIETMVPLDHPSYEEYFGVSMQKGPENRLVFSMEDARKPFRMSDEKVWESFVPELRKRLHELEVDSSFAAKIRAVLMELLPMGQCSIDNVASKLCVSARTLQRKLKSEGTNYQQQLNHSRELLAKNYLNATELNITEISFLLGFEEPSSFSRAFHIWTGDSPESYRSAVAAG